MLHITIFWYIWSPGKYEQSIVSRNLQHRAVKYLPREEMIKCSQSGWTHQLKLLPQGLEKPLHSLEGPFSQVLDMG
jgi:hypothetical protein